MFGFRQSLQKACSRAGGGAAKPAAGPDSYGLVFGLRDLRMWELPVAPVQSPTVSGVILHMAS